MEFFPQIIRYLILVQLTLVVMLLSQIHLREVRPLNYSFFKTRLTVFHIIFVLWLLFLDGNDRLRSLFLVNFFRWIVSNSLKQFAYGDEVIFRVAVCSDLLDSLLVLIMFEPLKFLNFGVHFLLFDIVLV